MEDRSCVHTACHYVPAVVPLCKVEDRLLLLLLRRPCAVLPSLPLGLSPSGLTGQTEACLCASDMVCTLVLVLALHPSLRAHRVILLWMLAPVSAACPFRARRTGAVFSPPSLRA